MRLQAPASHKAGICSRYQYQPFLPTVWEHGDRFVDAVSVVAELALKRRAFANGGIDQVAPLDPCPGVNTRLVGNQKLRRRLGESAEYRLTANDNDVVVIRDCSGRANDVLQLRGSRPPGLLRGEAGINVPTFRGLQHASERRCLTQ